MQIARLAPLALLLALFTLVGTGDAAGMNAFMEQDGLVTVEVESTPTAGQWSMRTSNTGFTGTGYYEWKHGNTSTGIDRPGLGILSYAIHVETTGRYRFLVHGASPNPNADHNDVWVRFPGANVVVTKDGDEREPEYNGDGWLKSYHSLAGDQWDWRASHIDNEGYQIYVEFNSPGLYTVEISGRSTQFKIDRFVLYKETATDPTNLDNPESPVEFVDPNVTTLYNGGFEDAGEVNKLANGWKDKNFRKDKRKCNKDKTGDGDTNDPEDKIVSRSGECAFMFKAVPTGASKLKQVNKSMTTGAGDTLTLEAYIAATNLANGGVMVLKAKYADGTTQKDNVQIATGTYDYTQVGATLTLTDDVEKVIVQFSVRKGSGKYFIDDVDLTYSEAAAPLPLPPAPAP